MTGMANFPQQNLGDRRDEYTLIKCIGGRVNWAKNRETEEEVAIKSIDNHSFNNSMLQILTDVDGHPNIVRLIEHFDAGGFKYLVFEHCHRSLYLHLSQNGCLNEYQVWLLLKQIAPALDFINKKKIIHRNLDLHSILLTGGPLPIYKITGFDVAHDRIIIPKLLPNCITEFTAPEEVKQSKPPYWKEDLYSLGKIVEKCLGAHNDPSYQVKNDTRITKDLKKVTSLLLRDDPCMRLTMDTLLDILNNLNPQPETIPVLDNSDAGANEQSVQLQNTMGNLVLNPEQSATLSPMMPIQPNNGMGAAPQGQQNAPPTMPPF